MLDLTVVVFEYFEINSPMYLDQRVSYTQPIPLVSGLKRYREVMEECKQAPKEISGDKWDLGKIEGLFTDDLWSWATNDGI